MASCFRDLLDEAKDYHLMPERRPLLQNFRTRPRCCNDIVGLIYAVGGITKNGETYCWAGNTAFLCHLHCSNLYYGYQWPAALLFIFFRCCYFQSTSPLIVCLQGILWVRLRSMIHSWADGRWRRACPCCAPGWVWLWWTRSSTPLGAMMATIDWPPSKCLICGRGSGAKWRPWTSKEGKGNLQISVAGIGEIFLIGV